jgi:hypothetical protein
VPAIAKSIEEAMQTGKAAIVRPPCAEFLERAAEFYRVPPCSVRVLAARSLRVHEHSTTELFGDYDFQTMVIGLWMRTAVHIAAGRAGSQSHMHSVYDVAYLNSCVLTYGQITEGCLKR